MYINIRVYMYNPKYMLGGQLYLVYIAMRYN